LKHPLFATSAHAPRRRQISPIVARRVNRTRRTCKHERGHDGVDTSTGAPGGVEAPTGGATLGRTRDGRRNLPSPSHGHLPLDVTGLAMRGAVRRTARLDVGRFVGLSCQPTSGFWRFAAVPSRVTESAESPVNKGNPGKQPDAGGGTRTPDTRIMIRLKTCCPVSPRPGSLVISAVRHWRVSWYVVLLCA
jgi:hypothetical protein